MATECLYAAMNSVLHCLDQTGFLLSAQLSRALPEDERAGRHGRQRLRRRSGSGDGVLALVGALRVQHQGAAAADKVSDEGAQFLL